MDKLATTGLVAEGKRSSMTATKTLKRKTPSELRGELLRRKSSKDIVDEATSLTSVIRNIDQRIYAPKKCGSRKGLPYSRIDDHYSVTKISRLLPRKEDNAKESVSNRSLSIRLESCALETATSQTGNGSSNQCKNSEQRCNSTSFKSIREISLGDEKLDGSSSVDMGIALKGLVSHEPNVVPLSLNECTNISGNISPRYFCSELLVPGKKIPLDLTLNTNVRLLSSSSVNWIHRLRNCATSNSMTLFSDADSKPGSTSQLIFSGINSWLHPQFTLPREAISALASTSEGFLSKRQQSWEDAFRSLYYMLRKKICRIFYVCSSHFVVMFSSSDSPNQTKSSCCAYIPQSTRTLRSLLKQHDVYFSMPLCFSKVEEATSEDLVELSEMEKHSLGQTRASEVISGVDNTPQSLLMFTGHKNVHSLYDFLLNYRSFLTTLSDGDVPVLISPVPFENAALSAPEVNCKQVRRVDYMSPQNVDSSEQKACSSGICYSVEIKGTLVPPWVISGICGILRDNGDEFQASFVTEPMSIGLNIAMDQTPEPSNEISNRGADENDRHYGISNTTLSLRKHSAYLKGLKLCDVSYTAFLSPLE